MFYVCFKIFNFQLKFNIHNCGRPCANLKAFKEATEQSKSAEKLVLQVSQMKGSSRKAKDTYMTLKATHANFNFQLNVISNFMLNVISNYHTSNVTCLYYR